MNKKSQTAVMMAVMTAVVTAVMTTVMTAVMTAVPGLYREGCRTPRTPPGLYREGENYHKSSKRRSENSLIRCHVLTHQMLRRLAPLGLRQQAN